MGKKITDYLLYRWRYYVGYGIIALTVIVLFIVAGLFIPGGISQAEMSSAVTSSNLSAQSLMSFDPQVMINLPFNILQHVSIQTLGLSDISIKLPSLLLGLLSVLGMVLLLKMWFRQNVAILTTVLIITTGQFLFVAQNGTPVIVYIFWSVWLLVAAMMISRKARGLGLWKVLLFSIAALSLYTPLSVYILIALLSAAILHPHLRYIARQHLKARTKVVLASLCSLLLIAPLMYSSFLHPELIATLLGIPSNSIDITANMMTLLQQYFSFHKPSVGTTMAPIYSLGSMALIIIGIYRLFTTNYTARSYIISTWTILLLPVLIINPNFTTITFVPAMLLMAMGISTLLRGWYQLFPRNPYARIAGLIPLTILIGGMFLSGVGRYVYSYSYTPESAVAFSKDLRLLNETLDNIPTATPINLLVSTDQLAFYAILAKQHSTVETMSEPNSTGNYTTVASRAAYKENGLQTPDKIVTSGTAEDADRFYVYNAEQK